jgi:hypothetical protein
MVRVKKLFNFISEICRSWNDYSSHRNRHPLKSQCLVNRCVAWLTWFLLNSPGAAMFKDHGFCRNPLDGSVMFLMVSVHAVPYGFFASSFPGTNGQCG